MIQDNFISKLKKDYQQKESERIKIIVFSNKVLHQSKKIIFSLQRNELVFAQEEIVNLEKLIIKKQKEINIKRLEQEGSYKAAMEEFAEAYFFNLWLNKKKIKSPAKINISHDSCLGALSDLCGEIARFCVNSAAKKEVSTIEKAYQDVLDLISYLNNFNLTGQLRNKYDQACNHLRKIEQVHYDIKIRKL